MNTCGTCAYFVDGHKQKHLGDCHRNPPTAVFNYGSGDVVTIRPQVDELDVGCGDWKKGTTK